VNAALYVHIVVNIDKNVERIVTTEQWRRAGNSRIHKAILIILGVFRKQTNAPIYNYAHSFFLLQLFVTKKS
jgi:hypothetical protein